jgi:type IX secretion system PorP/SprF family membrane protein
MKKFTTLLFLYLCTCVSLFAQDPQFSQYYASPLYTNPALTGSGDYTRFILNYRNQWPSLTTSFVSYSASFDVPIEKYNSGIGVLYTQDQATSAGYRSQDIGLTYSYDLKLNREWRLRTGLQLSYVIRDYQFYKYLFGDQIDDNGVTGSPTREVLGRDTKGFMNVGTGGFLYSKKYWVGLSIHNINRPRQDILGGNESRLPVRYSLQAGMKFDLNSEENWKDMYSPGYRERSITPTIFYKHQGSFDQLDAGAYMTLSPVVFGLWYRGIPIKEYEIGLGNNESLIAMIGFLLGPLEVGYSYDYTISGLGASTGGAHEVSLRYVIIPQRRTGNSKKRYFSFPCPKF